MKKTMKWAAAISLATVLAGVGVANAAGYTPDLALRKVAVTDVTTTPEPGVMTEHKVVKPFLGHTHLTDNQELLTLLKLTAAELKEKAAAGKTLAVIATEQGVSREQVISVLTKAHDAQIDKAVQDGKLTQEQAAEIKTKTADKMNAMVDGNFFGPIKGGPVKGGMMVKLHDNQALLDLLKLTEEQLQEKFTAGQSLAEIATAQGVTREQLLEVLKKQHEEMLNKMIDAKPPTMERGFRGGKGKSHGALGTTEAPAAQPEAAAQPANQ